jgi:hypothetical protein
MFLEPYETSNQYPTPLEGDSGFSVLAESRKRKHPNPLDT